jgi:tetratricopeptide (TPR) repeat protein
MKTGRILRELASSPLRARRFAAGLWGCAAALVLWSLAITNGLAAGATILETENIVQTTAKGSAVWKASTPQQTLGVGDRVRTRQRSRATVALTGLYTLRMDQFTTIQITPSLVDPVKPKLDLAGGAAFIFSRERAGEIDIQMPTSNAALRGTQLFVRVLPNGGSQLQVMEGSVDLSNALGKLTLGAGEAGEAMPGAAPRKTAVIEAKNILQWALYYPAVVDLSDLKFSPADKAALAESIAAYQKGNLLRAAALLPRMAPRSAAASLYQAGTLLAVGRLDEARGFLTTAPAHHPVRRALERMILAVRMEPAAAWTEQEITTTSEALAETYHLQSKAQLEPARQAALSAVRLSPGNGFAWTRLAELEFSAGRTKPAKTAITKAVELTPENARTHALLGFILSAENRIGEARKSFEHAVRLDGSFGNGWLGLGLTKIKQGDLEAGRADLQTACTVEPTVSIFHSYLGKAFSQQGIASKAAKDLELAALLDPNDPTPPLYSAIEKQRNNRPNAAIADLEESIRLNDNRRVYRSGFLLDQDRAVRSANLARIYQNAGMKNVAVREATRAVESDYTNPSAHLFLANSFDALRDPDRILLRYETPWFNELLLSNLLSPVGGGPLSQFVSQQEYSKMLEADGIGASMSTEWRSTSEIRSTLSVFGSQGNIGYGIDAYYRNDDGDRLNSEMELQEIYGQLKWQATPDDIFYFLGKWSVQNNGDLFETYDNRPLAPGVDFEEDQEPGLLLAGWNHRWAPGSHTLLLAGRLAATQNLTDPVGSALAIQRDSSPLYPGFFETGPDGFDQFTDPALRDPLNPAFREAADGSIRYSPELIQAISPFLGLGDIKAFGTKQVDFQTRREFEIHSAEIQHIQQGDRNTLLLGGRWQEGNINTKARISVIDPDDKSSFSTPAVDQHIETDYRRTGIYAYDYWRIHPQLTLIGGVAWDTIEHPENFRNPPVTDLQRKDDAISGKLGFTYAPSRAFTLRGMAAEGIGGLTFDESVRLEPSQVAGFNQAYRTVISESLAGSVEAPSYRILGLAAEGSLSNRTWWGASLGMIEQDVTRSIGAFTGYNSSLFPSNPTYFADNITEQLDYEEQYLALDINRLLGSEFSIGAGYRVTRSELQTVMPDLLPLAGSVISDAATLHEISAYLDWNSPSGFFAHLEARGFHQDLDDDPLRTLNRSGDSFVHFNAWAGYRFNQNACELTAGIMNIGGTGYQLSPLNPHAEIARDRTFFVLCRMSF